MHLQLLMSKSMQKSTQCVEHLCNVQAHVSAVKVDGERAYDRVRSGETVVLASREVTISQLDVVEIRQIDKSRN
jgi:hypothetical protein